MDRNRSGFSLVELLVVVVVAALMMTAVFQTLIVQQRGYRQQFSMTNARQNSRTTLDLLGVELRELSAKGGDLLMASRDSIRFRSYRKAGIVCDIPNANQPLVVELGDSPFEQGDSLLVYLEEGDTWTARPVTGASAATCPGGVPARALTVAPALTNVALGAPVRGYRKVAYGLEADGGKPVLARREEGTAPVTLVTPLASSAQGGLRFRYFRANGFEMNGIPLSGPDRDSVARIEVTVRGTSLGTGSASRREHLDSLSLQVTLRGN